MSGIELFSCDNIETYAAHVILLVFFEFCCQLTLNNITHLLFVLFFYPLLLSIYGLLGNVATLKKKWGGCDNITLSQPTSEPRSE